MRETAHVGVHWSFWLINSVALLWYAGGVANFIVQMLNADILDSYRESERVIIENRPPWATVAFGLAVIGGALGGLLLLLRRPQAFLIFVVSGLAVTVTLIHALGVYDWTFGLAGLIPQLMSLAVAAFLIWYSKRVERKGWIDSDHLERV